MTTRRVAATITVCAFLSAIGASAPRTAAAEGGEISSLDTVYMEIGTVSATNVAVFGDGDGQGLSGQGFRYYERHCCLARFLAAISIGLILSAGAASPYKSISSETKQEGDFEVTTTTYTYYTEEEQRRNREAAAEATASILMFPFTMELIYFPQLDDGKLHGFQWTWYLIDWPKRSPLRFETGFHWDRLGGEVLDPMTGAPIESSYRNLGFPLKVTFRPVEYVQFEGEFRWNTFARDEVPVGHNYNQMVRASATVQLPGELPFLGMFYGRATLQSNNLLEPGKTGYMLEVGLRL